MGEREVFGLRLRSRRRQLGWSQETLAAKLGMRTASISRYEQGVYHEMAFARLRAIARALQTSTDFLLGLSNDAGPIPDRRSPGEAPSVNGMTLPLVATIPQGDDSRAQYTSPPPP
jgi:transcriptional regulator with XRE-family HTH domain